MHCKYHSTPWWKQVVLVKDVSHSQQWDQDCRASFGEMEWSPHSPRGFSLGMGPETWPQWWECFLVKLCSVETHKRLLAVGVKKATDLSRELNISFYKLLSPLIHWGRGWWKEREINTRHSLVCLRLSCVTWSCCILPCPLLPLHSISIMVVFVRHAQLSCVSHTQLSCVQV